MVAIVRRALGIVGACLVALLSDYEAHPIAVMEALACGAKVLVTNVSGLADLAEDGLVASVELNANDEVVAQRIWMEVQRDHKSVSVQLPTWDGCVKQLESVYRRITNSQGRDDTAPFKSSELSGNVQVGS